MIVAKTPKPYFGYLFKFVGFKMSSLIHERAEYIKKILFILLNENKPIVSTPLS